MVQYEFNNIIILIKKNIKIILLKFELFENYWLNL